MLYLGLSVCQSVSNLHGLDVYTLNNEYPHGHLACTGLTLGQYLCDYVCLSSMCSQEGHKKIMSVKLFSDNLM